MRRFLRRSTGGGDGEDPEALAAANSFYLEAQFPLDPLVQRSAAQVLVDDEVGDPAGGQAGQPRAHDVVKDALTHPDGRIGPDEVAGEIGFGAEQILDEVSLAGEAVAGEVLTRE